MHDLPNKLKNKTMENKSIFKVGDKVYDIRFGWGEVGNDGMDETYPIRVKFNDIVYIETYTPDGYHNLKNFSPLLSFTEYTLQGFSQERPFDPQDCVGKWCLTWENEQWYEGKMLNKIVEIDTDDPKFKDSDGVSWDNAKPLTDEQLKAFNLTND